MADPVVETKLRAKDETAAGFNSAKTNLKEFGANVSAVGMRMTGMFTVPVVAGLASLNKYGEESVKTVNELKTALDQAIASNDPAKIAEAQAAWDALSPKVKDAATAYGQITTALAPANAALEDAKTKMLVGLVPVVERLTPLVIDLAEGISGAVTWFTNLPAPIQNTILGMTGVIAVAGPLIVIIGQVTTAIGSLQAILGVAGLSTSLPTVITGLKGVLAAAAPLVAPIAAFAAVLLVCDAVVKDSVGSWEEAFRRAVVAAQQLWVLANYFIGGKQAAKNTLAVFDTINGKRAGGGPVMPFGSYLVGEKGPEIIRMGPRSGTVIPFAGAGGGYALAGAGAGGGNVSMTNHFYGTPQENAAAVEAKIRQMKRNGTL